MKLTGDCGGEDISFSAMELNLSGWVAVLFSSTLNINILSSTEVVKGRVLMVKAEIKNFCQIFYFFLFECAIEITWL